jgi:hypothetical protein
MPTELCEVWGNDFVHGLLSDKEGQLIKEVRYICCDERQGEEQFEEDYCNDGLMMLGIDNSKSFPYSHLFSPSDPPGSEAFDIEAVRLRAYRPRRSPYSCRGYVKRSVAFSHGEGEVIGQGGHERGLVVMKNNPSDGVEKLRRTPTTSSEPQGIPLHNSDERPEWPKG